MTVPIMALFAMFGILFILRVWIIVLEEKEREELK